MSEASQGQLFILPLPDDAMAPSRPRGEPVIWSATRPLSAGRLVLLQDAQGQTQVRQLQAHQEPGRWLAVPSNADFATIELPAEGVQVLATHWGFRHD